MGVGTSVGDGDRGWWEWVVGDELAGDRVRDGMSSYQAQPIPMKSHTSKMSSLCLKL